MKRVISILLALICAFSLSVNVFAAVSDTDSLATRDAAKVAFDSASKNKFDVNGDDRITAADARNTLLTSAGLAQDNINTAKMDADGDGMVSAIDARIILRISAGLDSVQNYIKAEKLAYFNAVLNTAKPNRYSLYYNGSDYTANVTYTDPKNVVGELDKAFQSIDNTFSFAESLVGGKGDLIYDSKNTMVGNSANAKNRMMQILNSTGVDENQSSYLTLDDVSDVVYKQNQTYTFTRYGTTKNSEGTKVVDKNNVIYTESVTGLDSLTAYVKSDNVVSGPHASKAYIVYNQADLESDVKKVAEQFNNMSMEMSKLYEINFNVTPSVGGVKYYNGEITVYFDPADGKIVAARYSIYTDYTVGLYMDVKIFLVAPFVNVDKEGQVNITNTTQTVKEYYFVGNNPAHVNWKAS